MTENEFRALSSAGYNRIALHLETLADLDTPLSIYLKLANRPGSYLLESVIGGERFGRYSIVGLPARERLEVSGHRVTLTRDGKAIEDGEVDDPLERIDAYLRSFRAAPPGPGTSIHPAASPAISATTRCATSRSACSGRTSPIPIGLPEVRLLLSDELAVVDNLSGKLHLLVYANPAEPDAYARASRRLEELRTELRKPAQLPPHVPVASMPSPKSNVSERAFYDASRSASNTSPTAT